MAASGQSEKSFIEKVGAILIKAVFKAVESATEEIAAFVIVMEALEINLHQEADALSAAAVGADSFEAVAIIKEHLPGA